MGDKKRQRRTQQELEGLLENAYQFGYANRRAEERARVEAARDATILDDGVGDTETSSSDEDSGGGAYAHALPQDPGRRGNKTPFRVGQFVGSLPTATNKRKLKYKLFKGARSTSVSLRPGHRTWKYNNHNTTHFDLRL